MRKCGNICERRKTAAVLALSAALALGVFCETARAETAEDRREKCVTQEEIRAEYHFDLYSSLYGTADETSVEVLWRKVGENDPTFAQVGIDTGEQVLVLPDGYEMSFWHEIDNGGVSVILTPEQAIPPLYAARKNEHASGPVDAYLYEKVPSAAGSAVCYDLPQNFDYRSLGRGIASVKRVVRITETESGASRESAKEAVYLDINGNGVPSIVNLKSTDREMYRVQRGDTLQSIAENRYCDPAMWTAIFRRNRDHISHADLIYAGQMIIIPKTEAEIAGDVIVMPPRRELSQGDEALLYRDISEMADLGQVFQLSDGTRVSVEWKGVPADGEQQVLYLAENHRMTSWFVIKNGTSETKTEVRVIDPFYIGQRNENPEGPMDEYLYHKNPVPETNTVVYELPPDFDLIDDGSSVTRVLRIENLVTGAYYEEETPVD